MRVERRGRVILARFDGQPRMLGDEPVSEPKRDGKPLAFSKRLVWEAWRRVKTYDGAHEGGGDRASGGASGDRPAQGSEEASEERQSGCPASAGVVDRQAAAGVVDPA